MKSRLELLEAQANENSDAVVQLLAENKALRQHNAELVRQLERLKASMQDLPRSVLIVCPGYCVVPSTCCADGALDVFWVCCSFRSGTVCPVAATPNAKVETAYGTPSCHSVATNSSVSTSASAVSSPSLADCTPVPKRCDAGPAHPVEVCG